MKIEKYYDDELELATVTTDTYARNLSLIELLVSEIKTDFPGIDGDTIQLVVFGKPRKERMVALQFNVDNAPAEYKRLSTRVLCDNYLL